MRPAVVSFHLVVAACAGSQVAPLPERDASVAVFGDEAWRAPGSIVHLHFAGEDLVVATHHGSVVAFARDGSRRVIVEGVMPGVRNASLLTEASMVLAGASPVIVDLRTRTTRPFEAPGEVKRLAAAGTRAVLGAGEGSPLSVFDLERKTAGVVLEHSRHYEPATIVGTWAVAARSQQTVGIWDLATGKRHRIFALGNTSVFALSPDRTLLAVGTFPGDPNWAVDVYRVEDGKPLATVGFACNPGALAISPQSDRLAIACDEEVRVVKLPGGELVTTIPGTRAQVRTLAWSPSGDLLALGGGDNVLHAWRTSDWQPLGHVKGSRGEVRELDVAGRMLVSHAWGDSSAWLWSTETVRPILELGGVGREVQATATSDDITLVALTLRPQNQGVLERWRGATRIDRARLDQTRMGFPRLVRELGPIEGGGAWYVASGRVYVLGADLKPIWATEAPDEEDIAHASAAATADGRRIVMLGSDALTIIDGIERRVVAEEPYGCGGSLSISPDGRRLATVDERGIMVFDTETAQATGSLAFPNEASDRAIAWSGRELVVAVAGEKLVAWTPGASTAEVTPAPNTTAIAFAGDHIYAGRTDGTVTRRSFTALRKTATALPARPAPVCDEEGGAMASMFGSFGSQRRGRLPDDGSYDDDEVEAGSPLFDAGDGE